MRPENVILTGVCGTAVIACLVISWRGRNLPLVTPRSPDVSARGSFFDAVRTVVGVVVAGFWAGLLAVGLGGRLVMRVLGATSGDRAQGRFTEAEERVGEITLGGTIGFVLFVGLSGPIVTAFIYLVVRRILPRHAWSAGLIFGLGLLATFGVADPLSPDNVDFRILSPVPLAVLLVGLTALLFGTTFTALAARLDTSIPRLDAPGVRGKIAYTGLVLLIVPFYAIPAAIYIALRVLGRNRFRPLFDELRVRVAGRVAVSVITITAAAIIADTALEII